MDERTRKTQYIYLLHDLNFSIPTYKVGVSEDPVRRAGAISTSYKTRMDIAAVYEMGWIIGQEVETAWNQFFRSKRVAIKGQYSREWFHLTERDVRLFKHVSYRLSTLIVRDGGDLNWWNANGSKYFTALRARFQTAPPKPVISAAAQEAKIRALEAELQDLKDELWHIRHPFAVA